MVGGVDGEADAGREVSSVGAEMGWVTSYGAKRRVRTERRKKVRHLPEKGTRKEHGRRVRCCAREGDGCRGHCRGRNHREQTLFGEP